MSKPISDSDKHMLDFHIKRWQVIGSLDYPAELTNLTEYVKSILERGITDNGTLRQWLAIMAAGNREEYLAKVNTPSLIIHGEADEFVPVECGKATAMAIPQAKLKVYAGMGHDFLMNLYLISCKILLIMPKKKWKCNKRSIKQEDEK